MTATVPSSLTQSTGSMATAATRLMEQHFPWYRELGAQERSWVSLVAQAGITSFLEWHADPRQAPELTSGVFGAAPRQLARVISLEQTVALVRTTIAVVESAIEELVQPEQQAALRESILRYSREIAFSAAEVYARAAEARGAWDARLESFVVDALMRDDLDESVLGRVNALGWPSTGSMVVLAGPAPGGDPGLALEALRRAAATHQCEVLTGIHGSTLLAVVGRVIDRDRTVRMLSGHFGAGPVVASDLVHSFPEVPQATRASVLALRAVPGWPDAPRPVAVSDLLPERALIGDQSAIDTLIEQVHSRLTADSALLETATAYLERTPSLEATARALFVHPNTVRYRLRRIAEVTGWSPTDPRGATCLRMGLTLGRLSDQRAPL